MMLIWIDIKNSHEPAFFGSFVSRFRDHEFVITSRRYAEIQKLLDKYQMKNKVVGAHYGGNMLKKMGGLAARDLLLYLKAPAFYASLSHGSINAIHVAKLRRKPAISFYDNEKAAIGNKISFPFVDYLITPKALPIESLIEQGAVEEHIIQYDGFKEDIYEADFVPDPDFLDSLPFEDFIAIRPEALQAAYVKEKKSIVPDLFDAFLKEGANILYLPRYNTDRDYAKGLDVFIPDGPLKGLDVCYYSRAVLTGSGTFAREAACMGTPAVSFYPEDLLSVDQKLINDNLMIHSRNVTEIVEYVLSKNKKDPDMSRSKRVQGEVFKIFSNILTEVDENKRQRS
jgi:predicted glycosyltransferase